MRASKSGGRSPVGVVGLEDVQEWLEKMAPNDAKNVLRKVQLRIAEKLANRVRKVTPVDTGDLRNSIKAKRSKGTRTRVEAQVYADRKGGKKGKGYHAHLVEHGYIHSKSGRKVQGRPFVVPTAEMFRPAVPSLVVEQFAPEFSAAMERKAKRMAKAAALKAARGR